MAGKHGVFGALGVRGGRSHGVRRERAAALPEKELPGLPWRREAEGGNGSRRVAFGGCRAEGSRTARGRAEAAARPHDAAGGEAAAEREGTRPDHRRIGEAAERGG